MKTIKKISILCLSIIILASCSNDDDNPTPVNEEEVITTVNLTFVPQGGGTNVTLSYQDLDGDGPNAPTITVSGPFANNTTYTGTIQLLNETETPADNITEEVQAEDEDHQLFYSFANTSFGTISYNDQDSNGNPVGLSFTLATDTTPATLDSGLTVTLRHEPNKDGANVSNGDITNAGGETDVQVTFQVSRQ